AQYSSLLNWCTREGATFARNYGVRFVLDIIRTHCMPGNKADPFSSDQCSSELRRSLFHIIRVNETLQMLTELMDHATKSSQLSCCTLIRSTRWTPSTRAPLFLQGVGFAGLLTAWQLDVPSAHSTAGVDSIGEAVIDFRGLRHLLCASPDSAESLTAGEPGWQKLVTKAVGCRAAAAVTSCCCGAGQHETMQQITACPPPPSRPPRGRGSSSQHQKDSGGRRFRLRCQLFNGDDEDDEDRRRQAMTKLLAEGAPAEVGEVDTEARRCTLTPSACLWPRRCRRFCCRARRRYEAAEEEDVRKEPAGLPSLPRHADDFLLSRNNLVHNSHVLYLRTVAALENKGKQLRHLFEGFLSSGLAQKTLRILQLVPTRPWQQAAAVGGDRKLPPPLCRHRLRVLH
uniref:RYDR_ITPR domain-containing protein n=1 Tax=Macrostomum lignano TaxID=282301 RepID=A0A1I8FA80_9PLAT